MTPLQLPANPVPDRFSLNQAIPPNTRATYAELPGPGCIRHIWMTICREDLANRQGILRIYFDGSEIPHVEAPVGDFFGVMHGRQWYPINTRYLSVKAESGYSCYFSMPFARSARIEFESGDRTLPMYLMVNWHRYPDQELAEPRRFCARWRRENPTRSYHKGFLIADIDGPGDFLGFAYGVRLVDNQDRWSHGGADNFYGDGLSRQPFYLRGIGGEDTFGTSYGGAMHPPETHLQSGMPYYVHEDTGEPRVAQRLAGYRFFDEDSISFRHSLELRFGCMSNDICATSWWYQTGAPRPFFQMPPFAELLPGASLDAEKYDLPRPRSGTWLLHGPFACGGGEALPGETGPVDTGAVSDGGHAADSLYLRNNAVELGRDKARWVAVESHRGFVDFNHCFACAATPGVATPAPAVAIARSRLVLSETKRVTVTIAWDDHAMLRINGGPPLDLGDQALFRPQTIAMTLPAGVNEIMLKLSNSRNTNHGGWAFSFHAEADGDILFPEAETV